MQGLELRAQFRERESRKVGWEQLKDNCFQVGQSRNDSGGKFHQFQRPRAGMSIEPEPAMAMPSSQMDLPHALEGNLVDIVSECLSAIAFVRPDVVQVKQDAAISLVGNPRHKLAIRQFLAAR